MKFFQKKNLSYLVLIIILFFGAFLRFLPAVQGPFAFTYDVGRDLLALEQIVTQYDIPLIGPTSGLMGLFYGPWWYYMLTPAFVLGSGNPQGLVIFMGLTGVLTILLGYQLGVRIKSQLLGIIFSVLIAFSPLMIGLTTQIWNPNIAPLWLIAIISLLVSMQSAGRSEKHIARVKLRYIQYFLLGSLLALSIDAEVVYGLLLNVAVAVYFFLFIIKKSSLKDIAILLGGFIFILLPRILFEIRNNFLMTRTLLNFAGGGSGESFSLNIAEKAAHRLHFLFDFYKETYAAGNMNIALFMLIASIIILIYSWEKITSNEKIVLKICGIIIVVYYLGLTFFDQDVWPHYIVGLPVVFILITGIALHSLFRIVNRKYVTVLVLFGLSLILINPGKVYRDITKRSDTSNVAVYKNHLEVIDFIYKEANGRQFKYITYTPPVHDYTYKYLFRWYGENKYGYVPQESFQGLYFLIIEPDPEDPIRIENWLRVRDGDGITINERKFPSGVEVKVRE